MKRLGRMVLWILASCAVIAAGITMIDLFQRTPWGGCEMVDFIPGPAPGTAQEQAVEKAAEFQKLDIKLFKPYVESFRDHWIVNFQKIPDKTFFGCDVLVLGGDGPTVWLRKKDFQVTKVELSQ